jgi:sulfite reductase (NADPH) flavoprotein alpha-component
MLADIKRNAWNELIATATQQELAWMNGFLAGLLAAQDKTPEGQAQIAKASLKFTILFGTETGNAKSLATRLAARARKEGGIVKLASLDQYRLNDLAKEEYLFVVISTQGDGEPPLPARDFYDYIHNGTARLPQLRYAVLALGDTAYPQFCKTGEDVDQQLERAGGKRFAQLLKCDTDYEAAATDWFSNAVKDMQQADGRLKVSSGPVPPAKTKAIYTGMVLSHINLNDTGSNKATYHIELEAEDFVYTPGDALGIIPGNPESLVQDILAITGAQPDQNISYNSTTANLYNLLKSKLNIAYLPERVVKKYAALSRQEIPETKIGLANLLRIYPPAAEHDIEAIINILEPISPRLYSIASSPAAHNGTVHLTVSRDRFYLNEQEQTGLCSGYLAGFHPGDALSFYLHPNKTFRLPEPEKDIIMIGPGTGIAPFRAFLAEREATGSTGRNWLFFGDQHFITDFLYQSEIQSWHETGLLNRVNVAFSRDQEQKIYVQHKMLENASALYKWLEGGATVYVCGAREPMSIDVEKTLLQIIAEQGNKTIKEALDYLDQMEEASRYHKDVY